MVKKMIKENITDASEALFSGMMDCIARGDSYLSKISPFSYSGNSILLKKDTVISIKNGTWKSFIIESDIILSVSNLDTGSFVVGYDYYVYLIDDNAEGKIVISANSTFPAGYNANNSRKIGGFHYGHIRKVNSNWAPIDSEGTPFGTGAISWKDNVTVGIVPNSVWDLKNRPACSPEGMVKVGCIWIDIYQSSVAESITYENSMVGQHVVNGRLQSKYGRVPVTGTEGVNWYGFTELAARSGKRLLSYSEWITCAKGNPEGEDATDKYGWTKTTNIGRQRTGCMVSASGSYDSANGVKPAAISAYNIIDCVGNVWEWQADLITRWDKAGDTWNWKDDLGSEKGQCYRHEQEALVAILAGGGISNGAFAGARAMTLLDCPWYLVGSVGCRMSCDSL